MKQLLPGIWQWSWFSDEKHLDFNGLFLTVGEHRILVDPPPMTAADVQQVQRGGRLGLYSYYEPGSPSRSVHVQG